MFAPASAHRAGPVVQERGRSVTRLKRLELFGFKSFADRVSFELCSGVNVLVGPNGSGKSNVVDALRWVFGEQNPRLLRSQRWQEVIFGGSAARRPLALAEATVLLDNSDGALGLPHAEVEVSRRLLRSGETEYSINRQPCRLKDVQDLLAGTGAAAVYTYVGQSAVDEALNARPEDRRAAFEEAAGLARYRQRSQDAGRRLGEIEQASQRLGDLVAELGRQLEPLGREAELADSFLALRREREDVEALIWADAAFRRERRQRDAIQRRHELVARAGDAARVQAGLEEEAAAAERNLAILRGEQAQAEAAARALLVEENRRRAAAAVLEERRTSLRGEDADLAERLGVLRERSGEIERALAETASAPPSETAPGRAPDAAALAGAEARLVAAAIRLEQEVDRRRRCSAAADGAGRELAALHEASRSGQDRLSALTRRLTALDQQLAAMAGELDRASGERARVHAAQAAFEESLRLLRERRRAGQADLAGVRAAEASERERHSALNGQSLVARERLASLDREPVPLAAAAAEAARLARAAHGLDPAQLGDLLAVDPGYERATEAALGIAIYALLVPDWDAAAAIVDSRAKAASGNRGTAVFLPATAARAVRDGVRAPLDPLRDHVRAAGDDGPVGRLVAALLGGIAVTTDLPAAIRAVRGNPELSAAVTGDGRAVLQGGLVLDGPSMPQAGPVTVRRERQELAAEVGRLGAQCSASESKLRDLAARADALVREGAQAGAAISAAEAELRRGTDGARKIAETLAALGARREALAEERARTVREHEELTTKLERLAGRLQVATQHCGQLADDLAAAALADAEAEHRAAQAEHAQLRVELARAEEIAKAGRERRQRLAAEAERIARELDATLSRRKSLVSLLREAEQTLSAEQEALSACAHARAVQEQKTSRAARELAAAQDVVAGLTRQAREMASARAGLEGRRHRLDLLVERFAGEGRSLAVERKSLPPRFEPLEPAVHQDPEGLRSRAAQLTAQLAELGSADLGASEQHRRLRERQDFLLRQQTELRDSAAALRNSAGELEREMARRFRDCFEQIRLDFQRIFVQLFGGGEADLRLSDPDDLLSSGVEIAAQPPGKRMTSLALLSGGERALTAVALLFAVMGTPVAGFSVLDEVDAYLDEPNCARFGRYLRLLAGSRQFLVITHNRGTMEAADVLYGLTMEEQGVSRVVSVRLDQPAASGGSAG